MSTSPTDTSELSGPMHDWIHSDEEEEEEKETIVAMAAMLAGNYAEPLYNKVSVQTSAV